MNPNQSLWQGPLVLDTNVASWLHTGKKKYEEFRPIVAGHVLCLPFAVVAELRTWGVQAKWGEPRLADLERFIKRFVALPADDPTTAIWAHVHGRVRDQVGVNDEWIAACALRHNLPVVTDNVGHFRTIAHHFPALQVFHPK